MNVLNGSDLDPLCDPNDRYFCPQCLLTSNIQSRKVMLITDAQIIAQEVKEDFYQRLENVISTSRDTPHLNLICLDHQKEIYMFDLNQQTRKTSRLACVSCISRTKVRFTALDDVFKQWSEYELYNQSILNYYNRKRQKKIDGIQQYLVNLKNQLERNIQESIIYLQQSKIKKEESTYKFNQNINKNWLTLSKEEAVEIAEILSQPQYKNTLYSESEMENREEEDFIISKVKDDPNQSDSVAIEFNSNFSMNQQIYSEIQSENGSIVNLIRRISDYQFEVQQTVQFETESVFGTISDDGDFLITWDSKSQQIQIRKQQE